MHIDIFFFNLLQINVVVGTVGKMLFVTHNTVRVASERTIFERIILKCTL